jgi:signal transduction histidine kinase
MPVHALDVLYLLGILVVASIWGLWTGLAMAVVSTIAFDYFLIPPTWTLRAVKVEDYAIPAVFLAVALLTCSFSSLARSLAVEVEARREADLVAELARLMLRAPDLKTALPAAARRLARALGLPSASIELGAIAADERRATFPLHDHGTLGALLVPAGLTGPVLRRLRERVVPSLEVLLRAAQEREEAAKALRASRSRVVAAGDEARRRIERDLHDGTQQRLVTLGLEIHAIEASLPPGLHELRAQLAHTAQDLHDTLLELQELSRGLHPTVLAKGGLAPALRVLVRRTRLPIELDVSVGERLPQAIELTVYYVVSEALTNAAKHASASAVRVGLAADGTAVRLSVRDDGVGGADPSSPSGLLGMRDRVEALGGKLEIQSPVGVGTALLVEIPLGARE